MHTDARTLDNNAILEGDICIIGAGPAGISMAMALEKSGKKVLLLEGGGFEYDDRMQELYAGTSSGQRYFPLKSIRLHYFGGTSGHWAGFCSPFDEIDFRKRDWVAHSGWPITKQDLDPYYAKAQEILELGPYNYTQEFWQEQDPALTSFLPKQETVWNKFWQFSPPTRFGKKYRKTIIDSRNIHLYTHANVTQLDANENATQIEKVTINQFDGKTQYVKAKQFVLACCAIQNARLLLVSNQQATSGLGNQHDVVGRHFMEHIEIKSAELYLAKADQLRMYMWEFNKTKARAELAIHANVQEELKILNGTSSLYPLELAKNEKAMIDSWEDEKGDGMAKTMRDATSLGEPEPEKEKKQDPGSVAFQLFTRIEQAPNPDSRITLDREKDALGMNRSHLHWSFTELEKRSIRTIHELIGREAGRAGLGRVRLLEYLHDEKDSTWPDFTGGGWHHMGTTRMSDDPKTGVVDRNCKVHGMGNLHIAGSSCFSTAGAPNPTLTVVALSLRLADQLK
jgi:choline dehydrogenase-like flavoprotein